MVFQTRKVDERGQLILGGPLFVLGCLEPWNGDPKQIITLLVLAVYAGYLWLGRSAAWRGARASALCVVNFLVVLFSYSVVNLYLSGFHRFF